MDTSDVRDDSDSVPSDVQGDEVTLVLGAHVSGQHTDIETALVGTGLSGTGSADSYSEIHVGVEFHVGIDQLGHGVSKGCGTSESDVDLAVFIRPVQAVTGELTIFIRQVGAVGIGEMVDKGLGDVYAMPVEGKGIRLNDPKLVPVLKRCGELGLLINIHIAEPIWMYRPIDRFNDGLMNGAEWQVDTTVEGCIGYDALMDMFEEALYACPDTKIVACHLLNMSHDYPRLSAIMDRHPNLYLDISARFGESSVTPRATKAFIEKYQDRIVYGTDNTPTRKMFRHTFRLLETADEHIYSGGSYHWSYYGWDLSDEVLEKIYRTNALKLLSGE